MKVLRMGNGIFGRQAYLPICGSVVGGPTDRADGRQKHWLSLKTEPGCSFLKLASKDGKTGTVMPVLSV